MLGFLVRRKINSTEKKLGEPLDYMREMYEKNPGAFWQFVKVAKASAYRDKLPAAPFHVARLVAVKHQDCGPCVQTVVNLAKEDGVEAGVLKAALAGNVVPHGPHPGTIAASKDMTRTDELAVMVDTFRPLYLTKQATELDDPNYPMSWLE